jgi:hypothetical protein
VYVQETNGTLVSAAQKNLLFDQLDDVQSTWSR